MVKWSAVFQSNFRADWQFCASKSPTSYSCKTLCVIVKKEKRQNYSWKIFDELSASSGLYDFSAWQILLVFGVLLGGQFLVDFLRKEIGLITFTTKTNNDRNFEIYGLTIRKRIESGLKCICSFAGWKWFSRFEKK